jgi:hypothetical protein
MLIYTVLCMVMYIQQELMYMNVFVIYFVIRELCDTIISSSSNDLPFEGV